MKKYYKILPHETHPSDCLVPKDYNSYESTHGTSVDPKFNAEGAAEFYVSDIELFPYSSFVGLDYVETVFHSLFSDKFRKLFLDNHCDDIEFTKCSIYYNNVELNNYFDSEKLIYYIGKIKTTVYMVDKDHSPIDFWPHLRKFKMEDYVIRKKPNRKFWIALDKDLCGKICSQQFVDICRENMITVDFVEYPCAFDLTPVRDRSPGGSNAGERYLP